MKKLTKLDANVLQTIVGGYWQVTYDVLLGGEPGSAVTENYHSQKQALDGVANFEPPEDYTYAGTYTLAKFKGKMP